MRTATKRFQHRIRARHALRAPHLVTQKTRRNVSRLGSRGPLYNPYACHIQALHIGSMRLAMLLDF